MCSWAAKYARIGVTDWKRGVPVDLALAGTTATYISAHAQGLVIPNTNPPSDTAPGTGLSTRRVAAKSSSQNRGWCSADGCRYRHGLCNEHDIWNVLAVAPASPDLNINTSAPPDFSSPSFLLTHPLILIFSSCTRSFSISLFFPLFFFYPSSQGL